jgi:hypothetical protein
MESGIWILYKMLSSRREFESHRLSDSHTVLEGVNEFLPTSHTFRDQYV